MSERPSGIPEQLLGVSGHTTQITIRQVLGHLWGPHNECVFVVVAELGGTVRQTMHITLATESEAQVATAILNAHGHHLELPRRDRSGQPVPHPVALNGAPSAG